MTKPQTSSWLAAVVELCHHVLWMGEWTGVRPPWDGQLRNAPPLALLACWPLHGRTADLLRAVHVQASCLQPLTAWNRQTRAAEQLECCACRACQRGVGGDPPAAVELAERRSSACRGLSRAQCIGRNASKSSFFPLRCRSLSRWSPNVDGAPIVPRELC